MRWISSSSSDVVSFYSLSEGVQHVLPSLYGGIWGEYSGGVAGNSRVSAANARISPPSGRNQQQPALAPVYFQQFASSHAALGKESTLTELWPAGSPLAEKVAVSNTRDNSNDGCQPSRGSLLVQEGVYTNSKDIAYSKIQRCNRAYKSGQQSLGYVTTCVFSGGWGGYDETEVTVGTTEGYVYALPALWPPSPCSLPPLFSDKQEQKARGSLCACGIFSGVAMDIGHSAEILRGACGGAESGLPVAAEAGRRDDGEKEESSSLPFPASYVAAPVKRVLRLPYTVQHLQMLGAHTPALAADYLDELLLLEQGHRQLRTSSNLCGSVEKDPIHWSDSVTHNNCQGRKRCSGNGYGWCGAVSCFSCVSCCCIKGPLLSICSEQPCACGRLSRFCRRGNSSSASASAGAAARAAAARNSECNRPLASRVQQFFSSDRLLLALDKGGNGVVAHWPAPPSISDALPTTLGPPLRGSIQCSSSGSSTRSTYPRWAAIQAGAAHRLKDQMSPEETAAVASVPLAASFSLNLSVRCCASSPVATPLLAVVPCAVAAGGSRLLSVFDLVTSTFVFYARPPRAAGFSRTSVGAHQLQRCAAMHNEQRPYYGDQRRVYTRKTFPRYSSLRCVWSNVCCLSSSSNSGAAPKQQGDDAWAACSSRVCSPVVGLSGTPVSATATSRAAENIPISISSVTWLSALHPLLLAASTESGRLLLYDLRASPYPVFCGTRPSFVRAGRSTSTRASNTSPQRKSSVFQSFAGEAKGYPSFNAAKQDAPAAIPPEKLAAVPRGVPVAAKTLPRGIASHFSSRPGPLNASGNVLRRGGSVDGMKNGEMGLASQTGETRKIRDGRRSSIRSGKVKTSSSEGGREKKKAKDHKSTSISFLATPSWLTSAAIPHDAAILPCDCCCCRATTADYNNREKPSPDRNGRNATSPGSPHHQQGEKENHGGAFATGGRRRCLSGSQGGLEAIRSHVSQRSAACSEDEMELASTAQTASHGEKNREVVSFFESCAAAVVLKPRNSARPRPSCCRRIAAGRRKCCCCCASPRAEEAAAAAAEKNSSCCSYADTRVALSGNSTQRSTATSARRCRGACGMLRKKRKHWGHTHSISWRKRWFVKQEKALVGFFAEKLTTMLSTRSAVVDAPAKKGRWRPTSRDSPALTTLHRCCSTQSSVFNGNLKTGRGLGVQNRVSGKEERNRSCYILKSRRVYPASSSNADTQIESINTHRIACSASCVSEPGFQPRSASDEKRQSGSSSVIKSVSPGKAGGLHTYKNLPFDLLRLVSSPCSILSGFPPNVRCNSEAAMWCSSCSSGLMFDFFAISIPFFASCFFCLIARIFLAHRIDQHAIACKLSYHHHQQLLKFFDASDCLERGSFSRRSSSALTSLAAAAAAESAAAAAAEAARKAGVVPGRAAETALAALKTAASAKAHIQLPSADFSARLKSCMKSGEGEYQMLDVARGNSTSAPREMSLTLSAVSSRRGKGSTASEAFCTPLVEGCLSNFEKKSLNFYVNGLLSEKGNCASPQESPGTASSEENLHRSSLKATIERILPDLYNRHAENCMQLLRYAAEVLYAFSDAPPVFAKKSDTTGETIRAAAAWAAGLEAERCPRNSCSSVGASSADFSEDSCSPQSPISIKMGLRGKPYTALQSATAAEQQQVGRAGELKGRQREVQRCGCGRPETAVKAKMRRWVADEFLAEIWLTMRSSRRKGKGPPVKSEAVFLSPLAATARYRPAEMKKKRSFGHCGRKRTRGRSTEQQGADEALVAAAVHAVASSICLCEMFQSATFSPIVFFNVFRHLLDGAARSPFCMQKNCIRTLPVSDDVYQSIARAQLRAAIRRHCRIKGVFVKHKLNAVVAEHTRHSGTESSDVSELAARRKAAHTATSASRSHGDKKAFLPATPPCICITGSNTIEHVGGRFGEFVCTAQTWRKSEEETRTQQLFCLDEQGRVRLLLISLKAVDGKSGGHGISFCKDATASSTGGACVGDGHMLVCQKRGKCEQPENCAVQGLVPSHFEDVKVKPMTAYPNRLRCLKRRRKTHERDGATRGDGGTAMPRHLDVPLCSASYPACSNKDSGAQVATHAQDVSDGSCQPCCAKSLAMPPSCTLERSSWSFEPLEELLRLENEDVRDLKNPSEHANAFAEKNREQIKIRLCRRRQKDWCAACSHMVRGSGCTSECTLNSAELGTADLKKSGVCSNCSKELSSPRLQGQALLREDEAVIDGQAGELPANAALGRARLGRARTAVQATRRTRKTARRVLSEKEKLAISQSVTSTRIALKRAQIQTNVSFLRIFPLLPTWSLFSGTRGYSPFGIRKHCEKPYSKNCFHPGLSGTRTFSWRSHSYVRTQVGGGAADGALVRQTCSKMCSVSSLPETGMKRSFLREPGLQRSSVTGDATPAHFIRISSPARPKESENIKFAYPVTTCEKVHTSAHQHSGIEEHSDICSHICCRLQVEEEGFFDIYGKTSSGHPGRDSCRSRVVSLVIHENGGYILAATCAPSFLLYSSTSKGPLPANECEDRLLFGCAAGSVPPSRVFPLHVPSRGSSVSHAAKAGRSRLDVPTFQLPSAPPGPRPPPPILLSASPILPPMAAAPFIPLTLLRRQVDYGAACILSSDPSSMRQKSVRSRAGSSTFPRGQSANAPYVTGTHGEEDRKQTAFSDWLTDEEDEELQGGAGGSEIGSASDA